VEAAENTIKQNANSTYDGATEMLKTIKRTAIFGACHAMSHDQMTATGRTDNPHTRPCTTQMVRIVHPILPARRQLTCEELVIMVTLGKEDVMYITTVADRV
jgi:hypothetical protein